MSAPLPDGSMTAAYGQMHQALGLLASGQDFDPWVVACQTVSEYLRHSGRTAEAMAVGVMAQIEFPRTGFNLTAQQQAALRADLAGGSS